MDSVSLREKETQLLNEWAAGCDGFIRDGVVNAEQYLASEIRLLFLLKEVNGGSDWDLRVFLRSGGRKQTWGNIARWTLGIRDFRHDLPWERVNEISEEQRKDILQGICGVNVKKTSGSHTANSKLVSTAASRDADFLKRQIDLYAPDMIICCGTERNYWHDVMKITPAWEMTTRGIWYFREPNGRIVISYAHPEARVKDCLLYYGLVDAVREIMQG